jgi:hypothetical protein
MAFIVCQARKSRPRVSVETCLKCGRAASCEDYRRYREPFLFREMNRSAVKKKRRVCLKMVTGSERKKPVQEQAKLI